MSTLFGLNYYYDDDDIVVRILQFYVVTLFGCFFFNCHTGSDVNVLFLFSKKARFAELLVVSFFCYLQLLIYLMFLTIVRIRRAYSRIIDLTCFL